MNTPDTPTKAEAVERAARAIAHFHDDTNNDDEPRWQVYEVEANAVLDALLWDSFMQEREVMNDGITALMIQRDALVAERDVLRGRLKVSEGEVERLRGVLAGVMEETGTSALSHHIARDALATPSGEDGRT